MVDLSTSMTCAMILSSSCKIEVREDARESRCNSSRSVSFGREGFLGVAWQQWYLMVPRCELVARIQGRQHGRKAGQVLPFGLPAALTGMCLGGWFWTNLDCGVVSSGQGRAAARQAVQMSAKRSALPREPGGAGWFSIPRRSAVC